MSPTAFKCLRYSSFSILHILLWCMSHRCRILHEHPLLLSAPIWQCIKYMIYNSNIGMSNQIYPWDTGWHDWPWMHSPAVATSRHLSEAADEVGGESFAMQLSLPCPPPFALYRFQRSKAENKKHVTLAMGIYGAWQKETKFQLAANATVERITNIRSKVMAFRVSIYIYLYHFISIWYTTCCETSSTLRSPWGQQVWIFEAALQPHLTGALASSRTNGSRWIQMDPGKPDRCA